MKTHWRYIFLLFGFFVFGQENKNQYTVDVNYYYGSILPHSSKIKHLIKQHPEGVFISASQKTFGEKSWESRLNYPDIGVTLHYQNNKNEVLGDFYGLFGHVNFYFFNRNLQLRVGQGIGYNTNPYHKDKNYRNLAIGTRLMPSTFFMLNYQKEMILEGFGLRAGSFLIHHSNGTVKTPNTSINTVGVNVGIHYTIDHKNERIYRPKVENDSVAKERIHYNLALKTGIHEGSIIGSGQYPFYFLSAYADKRIGKTGAFQLGVDLFLSMARKHEIEMKINSYPEFEISEGTDYKRVGIFGGYEFFLGRLAAEGQLGVYIRDEFKENTRLYQHLGLKYYLSSRFFIGSGLKTHFSKAEAWDFIFGIRL